MNWNRKKRGKLYTSGNYELERWGRRWGVCYCEQQIGRFLSLADAKWWAEDHLQGLHELRLEESGNALVGGGT
jgi:hypothetical protein